MTRKLGLHAVVICVFAQIVLGAAPQPSFSKPVDTPLTSTPIFDVVTADLNGDEFPDLVVSTPTAGAILVAIGRGDGSFEPPVEYPLPAGSGDLAVADFNNDGVSDVVVAAGGIAVLLGNPDGTLQSPIFSGSSGRDIVVADFDRDGFVDVASIGKNATSPIPDTVDIYPGLGDGSFGAPRTIFTSDNKPVELAVGDFNGDGWPDLAFGVLFSRGLFVMVNGGSFAFTLVNNTFIDVGPVRTVTGDLDADGATDVVIVNAIGTISVLFGNGNGTLDSPVTYTVGSAHCPAQKCPEATWVELADMNGDGALDIVTANATPGGASILLNAGDGTFDSPIQLKALTYGIAALPADFNGDGAMDLAVLTSDANQTPGQLEDGSRIVSVFLARVRRGKS